MAKEPKDKIVMTPEQRAAFTPVLVGACIFALVTTANTSLSSAFVLFATKFNVATSTVVIANSFLTGTGFLLNQFSGKFMVKYGPRKSMMIAFTGVTVGFIILSFAPSVYVVWLGYACIATLQSFGQTNCYAAIVRGWVAPKYQGRYMGTVAGVAILGTAVWPVLGGTLFEGLGISTALLVLIPCYLIPAAIVILFLVKDKAEDCGVKPIGWSEEDELAGASGSREAAKPKADPNFKLLKCRTFWVCAVALLFSTVMNSALNLMTTSLQMTGMSASTASTVTSIAGLIAFPVNIVAGRLVDKRGVRFFAGTFYGIYVVAMVLLFLFFSTGNTVALWLFVLANALCRPYINVTIYMSSAIFRENATLVQPRLTSVQSLCGMFTTPIISALADAFGGYTYVTFVWMACAVLAIATWLTAVKVSEKEL